MITIIYSTHKEKEYNLKFKQHLLNSVGVKDVQILEYENFNQYSLSEIYNKGIKESTHNIVCCIHNDVKLETNWGKKLLKDFENNADYGIIGKAGSSYFPKSGVYWEKMNITMVGQVYHHPENQKKYLSTYSPKLPILIPVITIDGLFISFNKTKIKHHFDETIGRFHFYDHGFCIPNYLDNVKIGVTSSFEITHNSIGVPNDEFHETKTKFVEKYESVLPLDLKPEKIYYQKTNNKLGKNDYVAIIIPTKSKLNLLFDCINSFIENCDTKYFEIFVADTGSSNEEINEIKKYILENQTKIIIHLIQFDYYNFAKINNDVVKNHVSNKFKYLLFCNNDIKILNDVVNNMVKIHRENINAGTVGARLHFKDNTLQHGGILSFINKKNVFGVTHDNLNTYYNFVTTKKIVSGNTGALLMIKKVVFEKCGYFNENYITCFEDVELNYKCILLGYQNYFDGSSVAYHYESQTRNEDTEKLKKVNSDYFDNLLPFVKSNIDKLSKYIFQPNI
jgi:GT2 family glycosyltransferase